MSNKTIRGWCIAGFFAIWGLGAADHFIFEWLGESPAAGIFAPVNESVWEHLKMGFWGLIAFSVVEFFFLRNRVNNYFFAKFTGVVVLEITVLAIFYGYTALLGRNLLWLDIASFVAGVALCQIIVYRFFRAMPLGTTAGGVGLAGLIALALIFGIFTFHPPRVDLFKDGRNGSYGIKLDE